MLNKFKDNKIVSTFTPVELPVPNIEQLTNELDIEALAKTQARKNSPDSASTTPDANELKVKMHFQVKVTQAGVKVQESAGQIKGAIASTNLKSQHVKIQRYAETFSNRIQALLSNIRSELKDLSSSYITAVDDIEMFKVQNKIKREASYPDSHLLSVGLLVAFVVIESVLNGYFFAGGNDLGLLGGVIQAIVISLINITMGVLLGFLLIPQMHHISRVRYYIGLICSVSLVVLSIVFNLLVAHYRSALIEAPDNAGMVAVETFTSNMFLIQEIDSWMLFALGFIFFIAAAWKSYKFDDPYPGYGKLDRKKEDSKAEVLEFYEQSVTDFEELYEEGDRELQELANDARINLDKLNGYYSTLEHQRNILEHYVELLDAAFIALIKRYRDENSQQRDTPAPSYFNDEIKAGFSYSFPIDSIRDSREENQKILSLITSELPEVSLEMDKVFRKALDTLSELKQL